MPVTGAHRVHAARCLDRVQAKVAIDVLGPRRAFGSMSRPLWLDWQAA